MITIESKFKTYGINIPTDVTEITNEYFDSILKHIKLAENYAIVAVCYKDRLFSIVSNFKNNANTELDVCPILAKINCKDTNFKVGENVVINPSNISMGTHLSLPSNDISFANIGKYILSDKELYEEIISGKFFNGGKSIGAQEAKMAAPDVYFVEYKIVPVCDIKATYNIRDISFSIMREYKKSSLN